MNANRIIDMIVRQVMRRLVNKGVNKGFDMVSGSGKQPRAKGDPDAERQIQQDGKRQKQTMRQAQRMSRQARRFMKF